MRFAALQDDAIQRVDEVLLDKAGFSHLRRCLDRLEMSWMLGELGMYPCWDAGDAGDADDAGMLGIVMLEMMGCCDAMMPGMLGMFGSSVCGGLCVEMISAATIMATTQAGKYDIVIINSRVEQCLQKAMLEVVSCPPL